MARLFDLAKTAVSILDGQPDAYYDFKQGNEYTYDSGNCVMPVAGPDGTPPQIVKLYAAIGSRTIAVTSLKVDTPPILPSIGRNTDEGDIFISGAISLPLPQINSNQTGFNYRGTCQYEFVQPGVPRGYNDGDTFETGRYPFALPIIQAMALARPQSTVDNTGNIYGTAEETMQTVPSTNGSGTDTSGWYWLSTTWIQDFFSDLEIE